MACTTHSTEIEFPYQNLLNNLLGVFSFLSHSRISQQCDNPVACQAGILIDTLGEDLG